MVQKKIEILSVQQRISLIEYKSYKSVTWQCKRLNLNRSTLYYKSKERTTDLEIMKELDRFYLDDPTRGTRRMTDELQKLGYAIGRTHTRTLMQKMRLKTVYCRPRTTITDSCAYKYPYLLRNLEISGVNKVWAMDITYVPMKRGYMYLTAIMDLKSRYIVGWSLSNTMEATWIVETIQKAVMKYGAPGIINTDQGSQFTSREYIEYIKSLDETRISMDGKGRAIDNVFIERFWRTIKYEKLYLVESQTGHDLAHHCEEFIQYYNNRRGHTANGKRPPVQIYLPAA